MKTYTVALQQSEDLLLPIPEEILREHNVKEGDEVRIKTRDDGSIELSFLTETLPIELSDKELATLALAAHYKKQTLNNYILDILEEKLKDIGMD